VKLSEIFDAIVVSFIITAMIVMVYFGGLGLMNLIMDCI
jgi:hypothetical protein